MHIGYFYDYSRFTWTFFLRYKEEIFLVFEAFARQVQVKYNVKVDGIKLDHRIEFKNRRLSHLCNELGINHNFLAPKTP